MKIDYLPNCIIQIIIDYLPKCVWQLINTPAELTSHEFLRLSKLGYYYNIAGMLYETKQYDLLVKCARHVSMTEVKTVCRVLPKTIRLQYAVNAKCDLETINWLHLQTRHIMQDYEILLDACFYQSHTSDVVKYIYSHVKLPHHPPREIWFIQCLMENNHFEFVMWLICKVGIKLNKHEISRILFKFCKQRDYSAFEFFCVMFPHRLRYLNKLQSDTRYMCYYEGFTDTL